MKPSCEGCEHSKTCVVRLASIAHRLISKHTNIKTCGFLITHYETNTSSHASTNTIDTLVEDAAVLLGGLLRDGLCQVRAELLLRDNYKL